jgi:hypothetical protein
MDKRILDWLRTHEGKMFASPRTKVFGRKTKDFEIVKVDEEKVRIRFEGRKHLALPLTFSMFDRTMEYLNENKDRPIRLGAKVAPPYENDTIEAVIWRHPYPMPTPYKVAPHVCDILALAGVAEYVYVANPSTGRKAQAIKLI